MKHHHHTYKLVTALILVTLEFDPEFDPELTTTVSFKANFCGFFFLSNLICVPYTIEVSIPEYVRIYRFLYSLCCFLSDMGSSCVSLEV